MAQSKTVIHPAQPRREMSQYVWTNSSQEHKSYSFIPEHYIDVYKASPKTRKSAICLSWTDSKDNQSKVLTT